MENKAVEKAENNCTKPADEPSGSVLGGGVTWDVSIFFYHSSFIILTLDQILFSLNNL